MTEPAVVLAELEVRHTRRHQPTRRVALGHAELPTTDVAYGAVLLGAVVAEHAAELDEEDRDAYVRLLGDVRVGRLRIPRIAVRHRLQTDRHGLDRSRHRIVAEPGAVVCELDCHGLGAPQLIGAVLAVDALHGPARRTALRAVEASVARPQAFPEGLTVRRLAHGVPGSPPPRAGWGRAGVAPETLDEWRGVPAERRWAMEVLGVRPGATVMVAEVQRRFRRLVRLAHPDQGGDRSRAAERLAELAEARSVLLASAEVAVAG